MSGQKSTLTQEQLLRQRLLPQQLRLVALVEKTDDEVEQEIARELDENPALERVIEEHGEERPQERIGRTGQTVQAGPAYTDIAPEFEQTLTEALLDQLTELQELSPTVRRLTAYMTGALDSNGYLTRTLQQLSTDIALDTDGSLNPDDAELRRAYDTLRSLDPAGVGAQDLRDCLLLQLRRLDPEKQAIADATEIVRHYFDVYSRRNLRKLAEIVNIGPERIKAADRIITSLNPKPGGAYAADPAQDMANAAISPDFIVETDGERISVSMPNSLPQLRIEESFRTDGEENTDADAFIRDRRTQARTFIELLSRRQQTLMAIARAIVNIQAPFFLNFDDESKIRPMVLRQIAEATGLDLTLISRAVAGKWLATPWGVYSLKSFFNHRTGADDTETSAREIGAALRDIIDTEPADAPLSDESLVEALAARGYKVARRTVAKYRTRLNIPPARLRRK